MTSLQPRLVRADTLDLQSHNAPSAQDHSRSPTFSPYTHGSAGPHHREALRNAEESAYHDRKSSPRMSADGTNPNSINHAHQYDSTDDDGDDEQHDDLNGPGPNDGDYEDGNDEGDDDLEDDLLDKISSSPSIEDGKYSPSVWPMRVDSIGDGASPASSPMPTRGNPVFTLHLPPQIPLSDQEGKVHQVGHHLSKRGTEKCSDHKSDASSDIHSDGGICFQILAATNPVTYMPILEPNLECSRDINDFLFPADDAFLNDDITDEVYDNDERNWIDEGEPWYQDETSSDDDLDDLQFSSDSRFIDSGWGGECLREIEDIDFEFVYALHTFVATVEGQANATKGDTMVLLDDSNSYWWLVRVVKDGSIGYLPAEHIETPTERLARLNKHRNIDLSASMLGDNPEKSKNPLKKAMRRRNAKTVAFTAPTYYEPSEYDYDSEDDDDDEVIEGIVNAQGDDTQQSHVISAQETLQSAEKQDHGLGVNGVKTVSNIDPVSVDSPTSPIRTEAPDVVSSQAQSEDTVQRSRNGTVRNTDSFFKDDTVETKKISLTPRLLRNDAEPAAAIDPDLRSKTSADTFDKILGPEEKGKEKEKEKEREREKEKEKKVGKKGMLSGLFKRKDKSAKGAKSEVEDEKPEDAARAPQTKESLEAVSGPHLPEKKSGKLQKHQQPTAALSPKNSVTEVRPLNQITSTEPSMAPFNHSESPATVAAPVSTQASVPVSGPASIAREVQQDPQAVSYGAHQSEGTQTIYPSANEKRSLFAPISTVLRSSPSNPASHDLNIKMVYPKRAKERFAIDGSDSEDDHTPTMSQISQDQRAISPIRNSQIHNSRPDSAMEVSPVEQSDSEVDDHVPRSMGHTANVTSADHMSARNIQETPQSDTASTSKPSPSLATHTPSTSRSTPTWSDASLRSYMENDQDIRDLLIIVHDKSNITPVGPDHPLMGGLFMTERTRLAEMQTQLDSMLTLWISKKNPGLLAR